MPPLCGSLLDSVLRALRNACCAGTCATVAFAVFVRASLRKLLPFFAFFISVLSFRYLFYSVLRKMRNALRLTSIRRFFLT